VAALVAAAALVADGRLGAPARIYTPDTVPNTPVEPYAVIDLANPGFGWDTGLDTGGVSGLAALQVTGVGRLVESSRWVCDLVRSYLRQLDPTTVSAGGDTHIKLVSSQGPPIGPIEAGTLANSVETYDLYVEAS
jgi:hypothetical protein